MRRERETEKGVAGTEREESKKRAGDYSSGSSPLLAPLREKSPIITSEPTRPHTHTLTGGERKGKSSYNLSKSIQNALARSFTQTNSTRTHNQIHTRGNNQKMLRGGKNETGLARERGEKHDHKRAIIFKRESKI